MSRSWRVLVADQGSHRFPLPVSHSRAPFRLQRATAVMIAAALFAAGFATALLTLGHIAAS